jgi:hypothetical protein
MMPYIDGQPGRTTLALALALARPDTARPGTEKDMYRAC